MEVRELLNVLHIAERLKDELRHCETSKGRRESVAEHSWRLALMAFFMKDEFPTLNMDKVIKMCRFRIQRESFSLFLLQKYTHKQTENKKANTRRK